MVRNLALHFRLQQPRCQRDIGSDRNCNKKGLGSSSGTLPLCVHFYTHWVSRGRGWCFLSAFVPRKAALHHTVPLICVPALHGGMGWQHRGPLSLQDTG